MEITKNENLRLDLGKNALKRSNDFSWNNTAIHLLKLCKSFSDSNDYDFNDNYEKSAKRTLVTICLSNIELKKKFLRSLIQLDFSDMIEWALNFGLTDPQTSDFLKPLETWMQENQKIKIIFHDEISSNDSWMRLDFINNLSSMFYGKDYKDYFYKKGYSIDYSHRFNDNLTLLTKYSHTNQNYLPTILNYKNKLFKKRTLENRANFQTAPTPFEDGKHVTIQTALTINQLNRAIKKEFTYTVTLTDTSQSIIETEAPKVYLIAESEGWPNNQYEMKRPAFGVEKEVHTLMGGLVEVDFSNNTQDTTAAISQDSIYQIQYFYEVTVNLPPGSHAYRFLIDSTRYDIDDDNEERVIKSEGILKTISIVNIDNPYRFDFWYEYADKAIGSDFSYERLTFNYSIIRTLSLNDALTFRLMGGFSKKQLPVQKLFYVGGEGSVRGFEYMDTKKFSGNQMLLAKFEYHYFNFSIPGIEIPFYLFYDVAVIGNKFDFNHPISSYGLGITDDVFFGDDRSSFTFILYRTPDSNDGNWGIEFMWNYFFNQLEESDIGFILP